MVRAGRYVPKEMPRGRTRWAVQVPSPAAVIETASSGAKLPAGPQSCAVMLATPLAAPGPPASDAATVTSTASDRRVVSVAVLDSDTAVTTGRVLSAFTQGDSVTGAAYAGVLALASSPSGRARPASAARDRVGRADMRAPGSVSTT